MKTIFFSLLFSVVCFGAGKPTPSGPLKMYKGPEGEKVGMVEVNDSKEMVVYFKGIGGDMDGKSKVYTLEELDRGKKDVFYMKKKGSKTVPSYILANDGSQWQFFHPTKLGTKFYLSYSEDDSKAMKVEDVLNVLMP